MKYSKKVDLHAKKSQALIIHCADPRFQAAYKDLIKQLDRYHDLMVAPGASKAVVDDPKTVENIKLLESLHHFEEIFILDHIECGAFGEIADEVESHSKMLNDAVKKIEASLPHVKVQKYLLHEKHAVPVE